MEAVNGLKSLHLIKHPAICNGDILLYMFNPSNTTLYGGVHPCVLYSTVVTVALMVLLIPKTVKHILSV